MFALLLSVALADCPDVAVVEAPTPYDAERVWIHEPGWFVPLDDPATSGWRPRDYPPDFRSWP